jgi:NAD(P)-dependent dehydrogenase (short-subunit alcohol dehydrogenase family)
MAAAARILSKTMGGVGMSSAATERVAIITGAARGLGRAMALGLLEAGYRVVGNDIATDALEQLARDAAERQAAARLATIAADVATDEGVAAILEAALTRFGRLDILINNAGIDAHLLRPQGSARPKNFREVTPDEFRRVVMVNAVAGFLMTRAAVEPMLKQGWGRVINVTTSLDTMFRKSMLPYGPAKACNEATCAVIAEELAGTGVTVNILVPGGPVNTRLVGRSFTDAERLQLIQPDVMVTPLLWLVSDATDAITNRRFIAGAWNRALPAAEAAEKCSAPIAWPQLGRQAVFPPGRSPS